MLIWLALGVLGNWPAAGSRFYGIGDRLILLLILCVLGWAVFGAAVHK